MAESKNFAKYSTLDVGLGSEYISVFYRIWETLLKILGE